MSDDESIPWILQAAAERRQEGPATNGHAAEAGTDDVDVDDPPASRFRRVSGAQTAAAATAFRRPAPAAYAPAPAPAPAPAAGRALTYTPPPPPPPMEWDTEVETLRPTRSYTPAPSWTPPPTRPSAPSSGSSPWAPTPRKRSSGMIAAVVAGGLVLGGGGIGGVLLVVRGGAPSRAEFVAKADDDVCRPANGPIAAISKPTSYPELATAAGTLTTAIDAQLGQLRALDQPRGSAKTQVTGVLTSLAGTSAAAKRLQGAAGRADDVATIAATKDMADQAGDARTRATSTGFAACSVGMQAGIDAVFGGTQSIVKAGFVAEADVLCRRAASDLLDVALPASEGGPAFADFMGDIMGIFEQTMADIGDLPVAPGDEATVDDILTAQSKVQAKDREIQAAARADDVDRFVALQREEITIATAAAAKWDAYGIGSCGSGFGF